MNFEYNEDKEFFRELLKPVGGLDANHDLFDFRDPQIKRREFGKLRKEIFRKLIRNRGNTCELKWDSNCTGSAENVDHIIPLSSNKLNKALRKIVPKSSKKVASQSFGSNYERNFALACAKCNASKKHKFLSSEKITELLSKYSVSIFGIDTIS